MTLYFDIMSGIILALAFTGGFYWFMVTRHKPRRVVSPPGNPRAQLYRYADNWLGVPLLQLIEKAESQAQQEHYMAFPEDRPQPTRIITYPGVLTQNEMRERYLQAAATQPITVLGDPPHVEEIRTFGRKGIEHSYYIEGVGLVRADSREKLTRAVEVVLQARFRDHEAMMRALDNQIAAHIGIPGPAQATLRDKRNEEWKAAKGTVEALQALYDDIAGKPFGINEMGAQ